jgi:hypothetical protein
MIECTQDTFSFTVFAASSGLFGSNGSIHATHKPFRESVVSCSDGNRLAQDTGNADSGCKRGIGDCNSLFTLAFGTSRWCSTRAAIIFVAGVPARTVTIILNNWSTVIATGMPTPDMFIHLIIAIQRLCLRSSLHLSGLGEMSELWAKKWIRQLRMGKK